MTTTDTVSRGAPLGPLHDEPHAQRAADAFPTDDRALLDLAVESLVAQNRAHARRLDAVSRFHANRVAEVASRPRRGQAGSFELTPLQATKAEVGPLLEVGEQLVEVDLDLTDGLKEWFPKLWARCLTGRLDLARARLAHNQLENLTCDADKMAFAKLVEDYLDSADDPARPICPIAWRRFSQAVRRRCLRFPQRDEQDSFAEAFQRRRVSLRVDESGIGTLSATTAVTDVIAADYRLTLIARKLRESDGETRTLEQLRVDALVDLIHGRLTVSAGNADLEEDRTGEGHDPAVSVTQQESVGGYARPVINVTVPITTLIGLTDTPGVMAGDITIPADLARQLALHPEATWWRLLTDPAGRFLELSTTSYAPTGPIARWTVARDRTCVWPGCSRPASVCELDHRRPFPAGTTCTCNLQPLCRRHHQVKHSDGFDVVHNEDGSYTWTSRFRSSFTTPSPEYPAPGWRQRDQRPCACGEEADVGSLLEREFRAWLDGSAGG